MSLAARVATAAAAAATRTSCTRLSTLSAPKKGLRRGFFDTVPHTTAPCAAPECRRSSVQGYGATKLRKPGGNRPKYLYFFNRHGAGTSVMSCLPDNYQRSRPSNLPISFNDSARTPTCRAPMQNTAVFPVPDCDCAITSRPEIIGLIARC